MDIEYGISIWVDKLISADMDIEYGISIWVDMGISANPLIMDRDLKI